MGCQTPPYLFTSWLLDPGLYLESRVERGAGLFVRETDGTKTGLKWRA